MSRAFTLIELLVVISILLLLAGLAMPMVGLARRTAARKNTESLLAKVDTGLRLFRTDLSVHAFQAHPTGAATFPAADNRLGWRLAHAMTAAERADLESDLATARQAYRSGGAHELAIADLDPQVPTGDQKMHLGVVNRMAAERATLAILSGNVAVGGLSNRPGVAIVPAARSQGHADDYLSRDLAPRELRDGVIVDHLGRPLVYISPVLPGMRRLTPAGSGVAVKVDFYGLAASGRAVTASAATDMRERAPERLALGGELIGVGADGLIAPRRDDPANRDNVVLGALRGELQ